MGEKADRRVKYTKMVLREGLIKLLHTTPIDKITVKRICEAADVNRSTFYAHYSDQYDILRQIELELLSDIRASLEGYNYVEYEEASFQIMIRIFEYVVENAELCQVLLGENGDRLVQKEIMTLVQQTGMRAWHEKNLLNSELMEYALTFGLNGGLGIVQKWLSGGMKQSAREIAEMVINLTYRGLSAFAP
ncbi:MAG: TetR family transcriptional regulator C-terminal domain-containing protein [Oscillospiraceae bacterium]|jgi:AcrR family transcriptional regulator|nr:TetR family transcriptional regulator C-terminal domain-containing protein [Oscillospiraceae bacterium]